MAKDSVTDAFWVGGCNSLLDPAFLKPREFQWGINIDNTGGYIQTRHGFSRLDGYTYSTTKAPRGMGVFTTKDGVTQIIVAIGDKLMSHTAPFTSPMVQLPGAAWRNTLGPVTFVNVVKSIKREENGNLTTIDPYPVMIIQDGEGRAMVWDGLSLVESDPTLIGIPIGLWGQWSGNRYWVASGNKLRASNLGDPVTFTEEEEVASGGYFVLPGKITGMGQTPDFRNLLVFTAGTTSSLQSGILDRSRWGETDEFQKVILPGIGCAAGKSVANQFGMTWWYSHSGLIGLDQALQTYRSSRIVFRDQQMARSKGNLAADISGICIGTYGNYLLISVPSGDTYNAHTWVFNQSIISTEESSPAEWTGVWTGIRPVEWVTAVINGENRCLCLSRDPGDATNSFYGNIWEAFCGDRADINIDEAKKIACTFETRMLAVDDRLKRFEYAEIELAELLGKVQLDVYYCGMRGGYKKILSKEISASQGSVNGPAQVTAVTHTPAASGLTVTVPSTTGFANSGTFYKDGKEYTYTGKTPTSFTGVSAPQVSITQVTFSNDTVSTSYRPQRRTVRTSTVLPDNDCTTCAIESNRTNDIDRGFSLMFKWTGRLAIVGIRMVFSVEKDYQTGACEEDELTARYVTEGGCGTITSTPQPEPYTFGARRSNHLIAITPKLIEDPYTSNIP